MKNRLITTFVALVVLILGFRFVPGFIEFLLPLVLGLCVYEAAQILWLGALAEEHSNEPEEPNEKKPLCVFGRGFMTIGIVSGYLAWTWLQSTVAALGTISVFFWLVLFARKKTSESFSRTFTLYGVLCMYLLIPFVLLWEVHHSFGLEVVFFLLVPVWFADTGAYFVGKTVGKTPLAPSVSPTKTWEGFIGGLLIGTLSTWVFYRFVRPELFDALGEMSTLGVLTWGFSVAVLGQLGDLVQSKLKRASGVKDSGKILPGHGGMLDRIDSALFVVPVISLALSFFG